MRRSVWRPGAKLKLLGWAVVACSGVHISAALEVELLPIASGLASPVFLTHAGDGTGRLFVVEQGGLIRIILADGSLLDPPFLDVTAKVRSGGERGLLGLDFHPEFAANGRFFINYTDRGSDTIVAAYRVSSTDPNIADPGETIILGPIFQPESNHNGGMIAFGPDGFLYIGMGDGGGAGDNHGSEGNGQNLDTLLGKILRIDVDDPPAGETYAAAPGNPFLGVPNARDEIYAYGLRNPWRFSFDKPAGRLFCGDVGQNRIEEIDIIDNGGNYGWRIMEGSSCFNPSTGCDTANLELPIHEYTHGEGCSVTGGYVYRGSSQPNFQGLYFFGDFCSGRIWSLEETSASNWTATELLDTQLGISSFGEDEAGEIYVCDLGGAVYRLIDATPPTLAALSWELYN
ncbi:PQQ-dependent sugar dehydrogenase [Candidatus Sumerlaeota bacterium]|nr:PQQ-dependent sugar dehydrogenase [Candidatus Sumerlaeota bacterium]